MPNADLVFVLRVSLTETEPEIWRRLLVPCEIKLTQFHKILQSTMGWQDYHLHEFRPIARRRDAVPKKLSSRMTLNETISAVGDRFHYIYDFGDYWIHEIALEEVLHNDMGEPVLQCVGGAGQCPPEDVGGVPGYQEFLQAIADPSHEEHDFLLDWIGGDFDPDYFDLEAVNKKLSPIRSRWKQRRSG